MHASFVKTLSQTNLTSIPTLHLNIVSLTYLNAIIVNPCRSQPLLSDSMKVFIVTFKHFTFLNLMDCPRTPAHILIRVICLPLPQCLTFPLMEFLGSVFPSYPARWKVSPSPSVSVTDLLQHHPVIIHGDKEPMFQRTTSPSREIRGFLKHFHFQPSLCII